MKLSDHSLRQLNEYYINSLGEEGLRHLTLQLLDDLREVRERLKQTPRNSLRPPSSQAPFESNESTPNQANSPSESPDAPESSAATEPQESDSASSDSSEPDANTEQPKKKRGKPKGATGFGRTQVFKAERMELHHPSHCAGCGHGLDAVAGTFYTGFQELDIVWRDGADADALEQFRQACETHRGCSHPKTHALAVEFLNDWEAIFKVLEHPAWPLTNNAAERALRHWVMLRKTSQGTRSATDSRTLALFASVIDTCRQHGHSPWDYLRSAIRDRRAGLALPALPQLGGGERLR